MFTSNSNISTTKNLSINYTKCPTELSPTTEKTDINAAITASANVSAIGTTPTLAARAPITKIFIDDLTERRKVWSVPWFIVTVCILQISFYVVSNDCMSARLMFIPTRHDEYWRYLTYMLLHSDRLHLMLNIALQGLVGFWLECEQGRWRVAFIYAAGGISGSMAMGALQPTLSLIGASAGVYALLLSHIPHLLNNFSQLSHRYLRVVALIILCLSDVIFTAFHFLANGNLNPRICLEAHIAGAASGFCFGFLLYKHINRNGQYRNGNGCACI